MKTPPKIKQVESFVVTKRRHHPHHLFKNAPKSPSSFVTFEIQDGSQLELEVPYEYFTFFIEGDEGVLYYQDRAFLSFERTKRL